MLHTQAGNVWREKITPDFAKVGLERFPRLILMLDGDEAGQRASRQLAARLRGKVSLSIAEMPNGRQPDQLSSEEIGRILSRASDAPGA